MRHIADEVQKWNVPPSPNRLKAELEEFQVGFPIELTVCAVKETAVRCLILGTDRELTLKAEGFWKVVPGEIVKVEPVKAVRRKILSPWGSLFEKAGCNGDRDKKLARPAKPLWISQSNSFGA